MINSAHSKDDATDTPEAVSASFRQAMRLHAAGVCLVTVGSGDDVNGMAATAVTSFSMHPPSILVCVNLSASIAEDLVVGRTFGVTVLGRGHEDIVAVFSRKPTGRPRFMQGAWRLQPGRLPSLEDAIANLSCVVETSVDYGSHRGVVGKVTRVQLGPNVPSLIYRDGAYI